MRKIISIILTVIMILSSVSAFADGITSEELLSLIEKGTVLDIQNYLLTAGVEEIGVDISEFVENPDIQLAVIDDIYGMRYETIQGFQDALNAAIKNNMSSKTQGSGSSPSGGDSSSSGASGGSSSGGGGGSSSISRPSVTVSYKTYNFSGTVSLPDNEIAEEDIPVTISIQGTDAPETSEVVLLSVSSGSSASGGSSGGGGGGSSSGGGGSTSVGTVVTVQTVDAVIPKGKSSIKYETTWRIAESYNYAYAEAKIESDTYLQYSKSDIVLLDETTKNTLDIELNKPECYISGMFSLGESAEALPDDMNIQL